MGREIKFRAWDKECSRMIVDIEAINFSHQVIIWEDSCNSKEFNNVELMQYTNLKDKNDVEIYEGDICKTNLVPFIRYVSVFEEGCFMFEEHDGGRPIEWVGRISSTELEVIGNIYENKDLLK